MARSSSKVRWEDAPRSRKSGAPTHVLVIPKQHIGSMTDLGPEHAGLLGRMMALSPRLMKELGVTNGFRHVVNTGRDGYQEVPHVHIHVMGGPRPWAKG